MNFDTGNKQDARIRCLDSCGFFLKKTSAKLILKYSGESIQNRWDQKIKS